MLLLYYCVLIWTYHARGKTMNYHQVLGSVTHPHPSAPWLSSAAIAAKPKVSVTVLEEILDDVKRALAHDRGAAQAGIARLSAMLQGSEITPTDPAYTRGGFAPWQKRRVETHLLEHLEQCLRINTLAKMVSLSASHFCRAFKRSFGQTPHAYLTGLRVERAKQMMLSTAEPLSQIALACGLVDQAHLSKIFRRCVGETPSVWRRLNDRRA